VKWTTNCESSEEVHTEFALCLFNNSCNCSSQMGSNERILHEQWIGKVLEHKLPSIFMSVTLLCLDIMREINIHQHYSCVDGNLFHLLKLPAPNVRWHPSICLGRQKTMKICHDSWSPIGTNFLEKPATPTYGVINTKFSLLCKPHISYTIEYVTV
jgi:hypothetical protein